MVTPSTLAWPNSHHLLVCFLYSKKCITPKSEYCAVFAPLLEGVDAFFVGTSFLLMCCKELLCFHAPMATPSTLAWPNSHHLLVCFLYSKKCITPKLEYWAVFSPLLEGVYAIFVGTSFLLICCTELVGFHAPMVTPSTLAWPNSHHLLVCFLYSKKCITPKSEYCAVFAPLLEGVDAFFVGTSFLLMCCKELLCFHAPMATPSTLAWPNSHHLLVCFLYSKKCITPKLEYWAVFSPLLEGVYAIFVGTSFLLICCKQLLCLHAPMATPSTLAWPNSHHLMVCFLYSNKCITPKSGYCAVFAPLLEGLYAFFVGTMLFTTYKCGHTFWVVPNKLPKVTIGTLVDRGDVVTEQFCEFCFFIICGLIFRNFLDLFHTHLP